MKRREFLESALASLATGALVASGLDAAMPAARSNLVMPREDDIFTLLNKAWHEMRMAGDAPDIILAGNDAFTAYNDALSSTQRFASRYHSTQGHASLMYQGVPVVFDDQMPRNQVCFASPDRGLWGRVETDQGKFTHEGGRAA